MQKPLFTSTAAATFSTMDAWWARTLFIVVLLGATALGIWFAFGPGASSVATWRVDGELDRSARSLPLLVTEGDCASGRSAKGRVQTPDVDYQRDAVIITVRVDRRSASEECPSNPETPYVLKLDEPIGERKLLDGGRSPAAPPVPR